MKSDEVFFLYSPIHLVLAYAVIRELNLKKVCVIVSGQLLKTSLFQSLKDELKVEAIAVPFMGSNKNVLIRAMALIIGLSRLLNVRCDRFWTANELSPYSHYLKNRNRYKKLGILDEGMLKNVIDKENEMTRYGRKRFIRRVFKVGGDRRFNNEKMTDAVLFSPDDDAFNCLGEMSVCVRDATALLAKYEADLIAIFRTHLSGLESESPAQSQRCLLVTSPLSENRNAAYRGQELDLIRKLIAANPTIDFHLKLHYRESSNKYVYLEKEFENFFFKEFVQDVPAQYLAPSFDLVCGFHSSVLEHVASTSTVYTLSSQVQTQHSLIFLENISSAVTLMPDDFRLDQH